MFDFILLAIIIFTFYLLEEKLSKNKCKTNELYINVLKKIQEIEDSSYYAFQLASALFSNKKFSESSKVLKQMLDMYDLTDDYKVRLYLDLANSLRIAFISVLLDTVFMFNPAYLKLGLNIILSSLAKQLH